MWPSGNSACEGRDFGRVCADLGRPPRNVPYPCHHPLQKPETSVMSYVVSVLQGGLGNQLFQYAVARSIALELGLNVHLNTCILQNPTSRDTPRHYDLGPYNLSVNLVNFGRNQIRLRYLQQRYFQYLDISKLYSNKTFKHWIYEGSNFNYTRIFQISPPIVLIGWWQSEKYFRNIEGVLRHELVPSCRSNTEAMQLIKRLKSQKGKSVSLHIRRGDYLTNRHASDYHGTCSLNYYKSALETLYHKLGICDLYYYIFSDDVEWAVSNIVPMVPNSMLVSNNLYFTHHDELTLMSHCSHHIIANSSFSWWGAWLNPSSDKIVVAPRDWYRNSPAPDDLIPNGWLQV